MTTTAGHATIQLRVDKRCKYEVYALMNYTGRHCSHLLPPSSLSPLQATSAKGYRRSPWGELILRLLKYSMLRMSSRESFLVHQS
jgi:hypothetical protein